MAGTRPAAVAGTFYPGEASSLAAQVGSYLRAARGETPPIPAKALIAPHAGYIYSGPIAASAYTLLEGRRGQVRRVVLAGPAHRVYVRGAAVPSAQSFASPLGPVPVDAEAVAALRALAFIEVSDRAHAFEHSLEVHLPFLQSMLGAFTLVPMVVGEASPEEMAQAFATVWGGDETLVVVSSDLSHYLPYEDARARDRETAKAIVGLEARIEPEEACGAAPINGLLTLARRRGMRVELLDLRNSGDTAGERDHVVGYASFAVREPDAAHGRA